MAQLIKSFQALDPDQAATNANDFLKKNPNVKVLSIATSAAVDAAQGIRFVHLLLIED